MEGGGIGNNGGGAGLISGPQQQMNNAQMNPNQQQNPKGGLMVPGGIGIRPPQGGVGPGGPQQNTMMTPPQQQQQQQQGPGASQQGNNTNSASAGGSGTGSQQITDERKKQIQQQLQLLFHSHKCNRRDNSNNNREKCNVPYCKLMQDLLNHMGSCKESRDCTAQHCISSRQILLHYKTCFRPDCVICYPFRQGHAYQNMGGTGVPNVTGNNSVKGGISSNVPNVGAPGSSGGNNGGNDKNKDWRELVTDDLRKHLVHKFVQAVFPTSDPAIMLDKRMHKLVSYAEKVERDMYEKAKSRSEYYHLLAEQIYKIQKEHEKNRLKRKEQQMLQMQQQQQVGGAGGSPVVGSSSVGPIGTVGLTVGTQQQLPPGHPQAQQQIQEQIRPMVSPLGGAGEPGTNQGIPMNSGGMMQQLRDQTPVSVAGMMQSQNMAAMRSHSPGGNMLTLQQQQQRMQYPQQQGNMLVGPPGPSPGGNDNNDGTAKLEIKTEDSEVKIKSEPVDVDDSNADNAMCITTGDNKDSIKPISEGNNASSEAKCKTEPKPVVSEPLMPNAGDKKKKCDFTSLV